MPVRIDTSTTRDVTKSETGINTIAAMRSDHGARLKNSHHTTIATAETIAPINAEKKKSGARIGTPNLRTHKSNAAATPGHNRSGLREVGLILTVDGDRL